MGQVIDEVFALSGRELVVFGNGLGVGIAMHTLQIASPRDIPHNHRAFVSGELQ